MMLVLHKNYNINVNVNYCSTEVINEQQLWRRARKKVVSFTLFNAKQEDIMHRKPFEAYFDGFKDNVAGAALYYYPGWIV
jgi:hypothetical protein